MRNLVTVGVFALVLSGCGGGSSGSDTGSPAPSPGPGTTPPPSVGSGLTPQLSNNNLDIYFPNDIQTGSAIGLVARAKNGRLSQSEWRQVSGPAVTMLASNSQAVGFDVIDAGNYTFSFSATINGQSTSEQVSFTVNQASTEGATIRLDHAAAETAKVSLRVAGGPSDMTSVTWEQTSGPQVTFTTGPTFDTTLPQQSLFFDAPSVAQDQVVQFRATVQFADGTTSQDTAMVVVQDVAADLANGYFPRFSEKVVTTDMHPYQADSAYARGLRDCVYNNTVANSCNFSRLPLIGQVTSTPSVDDILDRTFVSHQWMGDRFKQFLNNSSTSQDMRNLLRATTAVVISYDVRPSFYWTATGAIYLDAANFWVTPEERDTLNDAPDFRASFGNDLTFIMPWRYVKDGRSYLGGNSYPVDDRLSKSIEDMEASITWLMYHELAHANDFFPPTSWAGLSQNASPLGTTQASGYQAQSDIFNQRFPLSSSQMRALAQVSFAGQDATDQQKANTPADVQSFFEPDDAPAYYSYSTIREDYATLFERFMMQHRLGVSADVGLIERDNSPVVSWGQRDRVNAPNIQGRTADVVNRILPGINVSAAQQNMPAPRMLIEGRTWNENLDLDQQAASKTINGKPTHQHDFQQGFHHVYPKQPSQ